MSIDGKKMQRRRAQMSEKVLTHGTEALSDVEVLEMLLFLAFKKLDTRSLAKSLINRFGSFADVVNASPHELLETPSFSRNAVLAVGIVRESVVRLVRGDVDEHPTFHNWDGLMEYLYGVMARDPVGQLRVLFLNPNNRLIANEVQLSGMTDYPQVYSRDVMTRALELRATALLMVQHQPTGDLSPSLADVRMAADVNHAAASLEIKLHDHILLGRASWISFRREGLL